MGSHFKLFLKSFLIESGDFAIFNQNFMKSILNPSDLVVLFNSKIDCFSLLAFYLLNQLQLFMI